MKQEFDNEPAPSGEDIDFDAFKDPNDIVKIEADFGEEFESNANDVDAAIVKQKRSKIKSENVSPMKGNG